MSAVLAAVRPCCPSAIVAAGRKFRAVCSCGWRSTPRVSTRAALDAIECEHGFSAEWWRRDGDVNWNASAKLAAIVRL